MLTCVAKSRLQLFAALIIPFSRLRITFNVHLHTVLFHPLTPPTSAIVWLALCPVGCFWRQSLAGANPGPDILDLAYADPVVGAFPGQPAVEMPDLLLVLDGHHVGVVLPAPGSGLRPRHVVVVRVEVGPAFYIRPYAQH